MIAIAMARSGARVLLIDGDLHRPAVHRYFGLTRRTGLTTVLSGHAALEAAVQRNPESPRLDILTSGPVPPVPGEVIGSKQMRDMLREAAETYRIVLIDSPPLLAVGDGSVLAATTDKVVWVVGLHTSTQDVRRCRRLLESVGAEVGIVLNGIDMGALEEPSGVQQDSQ